jgi:cyclohexanecarboxylate-CoA ligase
VRCGTGSYSGNGSTPTRATDTGFTSADVVFTPNALTHAVGQTFVNLLPLYVGGQALVCDTADPDAIVDLMTTYGVTTLAGAPVFLASITEAAGRSSQKPAALKRVMAGASMIPAALVDLVADRFGLALLGGWGMTEVIGTTMTSPADPPDWALHSVGRPHAALETDCGATAARRSRPGIPRDCSCAARVCAWPRRDVTAENPTYWRTTTTAGTTPETWPFPTDAAGSGSSAGRPTGSGAF